MPKKEKTNQQLSEPLKKPKTDRYQKVMATSDKIAIVSLILVVVNIIATLSLNLFQQNKRIAFESTQTARDQDFQVATSTATISLTTTCHQTYTCPYLSGDTLTVNNFGMAPAKNVTLIISITKIDNSWQTVFTPNGISSIEDFDFSISDPSIDIELSFEKADHEAIEASYLDYLENNVIRININNLPPNKPLTIRFFVNKDHPNFELYNNTVYYTVVYNPEYYLSRSREELLSELEKSYILQILNPSVIIADFQAIINCDNCQFSDNNLNTNTFSITSIERAYWYTAPQLSDVSEIIVKHVIDTYYIFPKNYPKEFLDYILPKENNIVLNFP